MTTMMTTTRKTSTAAADTLATMTAARAGAALVLAALALTACSGSAQNTRSGAASGAPGAATGFSSTSGGLDTVPSPVGGAGASALSDGSNGAKAAGGSTGSGERLSARVLPHDRAVVYRGAITVAVDDVAAAVTRVEDLATGAGGLVFDERTQTDPAHPTRGSATVTVQVPPTSFGSTLDSVARLGRQLSRSRSAEDVTSQVIDVDSRIASQQVSVARMRALLARATTVGQVVQVESELSRREADLESFQAQLKALRDTTDLATVQVTLVPPQVKHVTPAKKAGTTLGFLHGLRGGWDAFLAMLAVALTVVGALVPFAVALALIGVPALVVWRSRRRQRPTAPVAPAA